MFKFTDDHSDDGERSPTISLSTSDDGERWCGDDVLRSLSLSSVKSNNGLSSDQKREFLERYGLNPDDFLSKPSPKVLGGTAKRKKLLSPKGMDVRPMMEVVKGAAFDTLQAAGGCPVSLRPGRWLDLYSGTRSVGIKALSWGCSEEVWWFFFLKGEHMMVAKELLHMQWFYP